MRSQELSYLEDPDADGREDESNQSPGQLGEMNEDEMNDQVDTLGDAADSDLDADTLYDSLDQQLDSLNQVLDDMDRKSDDLKDRILNLLTDMRSGNEESVQNNN